ncbi:hypothetical protein AB4254_08090 [Vibrio breoganii]
MKLRQITTTLAIVCVTAVTGLAHASDGHKGEHPRLKVEHVTSVSTLPLGATVPTEMKNKKR